MLITRSWVINVFQLNACIHSIHTYSQLAKTGNDWRQGQICLCFVSDVSCDVVGVLWETSQKQRASSLFKSGEGLTHLLASVT